MASSTPPSPIRPPSPSSICHPSTPKSLPLSSAIFLGRTKPLNNLRRTKSLSFSPPPFLRSLPATPSPFHSLQTNPIEPLAPSSTNPLPPLLPTPTVLPNVQPPLADPSAIPINHATQSSYTWASRLVSHKRVLTKIAGDAVRTTEGNPRVKIPNSVFLKGASYHKEFLIGLFYGDPPGPGQVRGVLNYLWGKNINLEIHRLSHIAYIIRIPSEVLRNKILLKELWRVGDSLLFVGAWKPEYSLHPPTIETAPVWVHFSGLPFDLITREGLSYVASLIGDPLDVDEFTKKIKSHDTAHVKVEVDLGKPLPEVVEIEKEDGSILTVKVEYPHLPPICQICKRLGHKQRHCPSANFQWVRKRPEVQPPPDCEPTLNSESQVSPTPIITTTQNLTSLTLINPTQTPPNPIITATPSSSHLTTSLTHLTQRPTPLTPTTTSSPPISKKPLIPGKTSSLALFNYPSTNLDHPQIPSIFPPANPSLSKTLSKKDCKKLARSWLKHPTLPPISSSQPSTIPIQPSCHTTPSPTEPCLSLCVDITPYDCRTSDLSPDELSGLSH